jgi:hypothetical protein
MFKHTRLSANSDPLPSGTVQIPLPYPHRNPSIGEHWPNSSTMRHPCRSNSVAAALLDTSIGMDVIRVLVRLQIEIEFDTIRARRRSVVLIPR